MLFSDSLIRFWSLIIFEHAEFLLRHIGLHTRNSCLSRKNSQLLIWDAPRLPSQWYYYPQHRWPEHRLLDLSRLCRTLQQGHNSFFPSNSNKLRSPKCTARELFEVITPNHPNTNAILSQNIHPNETSGSKPHFPFERMCCPFAAPWKVGASLRVFSWLPRGRCSCGVPSEPHTLLITKFYEIPHDEQLAWRLKWSTLSKKGKPLMFR